MSERERKKKHNWSISNGLNYVIGFTQLLLLLLLRLVNKVLYLMEGLLSVSRSSLIAKHTHSSAIKTCPNSIESSKFVEVKQFSLCSLQNENVKTSELKLLRHEIHSLRMIGVYSSQIINYIFCIVFKFLLDLGRKSKLHCLRIRTNFRECACKMKCSSQWNSFPSSTSHKQAIHVLICLRNSLLWHRTKCCVTEEIIYCSSRLK